METLSLLFVPPAEGGGMEIIMKNSSMKARIICSLVANYPIMKDWKGDINQAILLHTNTDCISLFAKLIKGDGILLSADLGKVSIREEMKKLRSNQSEGPVVLMGRPGTATTDFYNRTVYTFRMGQLFDDENGGLLFIITDYLPELEDTDSIFYIDATDITAADVDLKEEDYVPVPSDLDYIKAHDIGAWSTNGSAADYLCLATSFLEPIVFRGDEDFADYKFELNQMLACAEEYNYLEELSDLFIEEFYDYLLEKRINLHNMERRLIIEAGEFCDDDVYYDDRYVFISENQLRAFCDEYLMGYSYSAIKNSLRFDGFISSDSPQTYTAKLRFLDHGEKKSRRMVRFVRQRLELPGGVDLIDRLDWAAENGE